MMPDRRTTNTRSVECMQRSIKIGVRFLIFTLGVILPSWCFSQTIGLKEDFDGGTIPLGWQQVSLAGNQSWNVQSSGVLRTGMGMNGYAGGNYFANEDWLISPAVDLNTYAYPTLTFFSRTNFNGNPIEVLLSNNYTGGSPLTANWINLNVALPSINSDTWVQTRTALNNFSSQTIRLAFRYTSTTTDAAQWRLDQVRIIDSVTKSRLSFSPTVVGTSSNIQTVQFFKKASSLPYTVWASPPFQVSTDSINFSDSVQYTITNATTPQTLYVRYTPQQTDQVEHGRIEFRWNQQLLSNTISLLGISIPDNKCIRVMSWNMRWFGSPTDCACDTSWATQQSAIIMQSLEADMYCLQEVVSAKQLRAVQEKLGPQYQTLVSNFCSFATDSLDSSYPSGQKLAFIYNTNKISAIKAYGLLLSTYPANTNPYSCFASGRFPFMLEAKLNLANGADTVIFCNIHGKAGNTQSDYDRRNCATQFMTDSLLSLYPGKKIMVIGDYNDYVQGSTSSWQPNTSYSYLLSNGFAALSLPSVYWNETSYVGSENHIIDNLSCSHNLLSYYADSSLFFVDDLLDVIPDYPNATSDHLPFYSVWKFNNPSGLIESAIQPTDILLVNPSSSTLEFRFKETDRQPIEITVHNTTGTLLYSGKHRSEASVAIPLPLLTEGLYFVSVKKNNQNTLFKWLVIQ